MINKYKKIKGGASYTYTVKVSKDWKPVGYLVQSYFGAQQTPVN